jgi:uncharacterized cupredoxin-like copper-binding protein
MRGFLVGVAAAVAAVGVVGAADAAQQPAQHALIAKVNVAASEFKFALNHKTAKRGVVVFKVTNVGALPHDFKIKGRKTRLLQHGDTATLRVTFLRKGHYQYVCTVSGHAAAGMKGVFTVT